MKLNLLALIASGALGLAIATTAVAAPTDSAESLATARVSYTDLNLATDAGMGRLYARLRSASASVCGHADIRDLKAVSQEQACVAHALAGAIEQLGHANSTRLAAL